MDVLAIMKKMHNSGPVKLVNAPADMITMFRPFHPSGKGRLVVLFIKDMIDFRRFGKANLGRTEYDSNFWMAYPKSSQLGTDLNREIILKTLLPLGYRPVSQISLGAIWSGLRIRPIVER